MVKSELIHRILKQNPKLGEADCRRLIDAFFDTMVEQLSQRRPIELRGFGTFTVKLYGGRIVRDPRTGSVTSKNEIVGVRFRTGKSLGASINRI